VIGYRTKESDPKEYDFFRVFYYDTSSHIKREINLRGYYPQWSFVMQATFEPSATPDIVFTFHSCLECEAVELLSLFRFDEKDGVWKVRVWPDGDPDLMIGSDRQYGAEDDWVYDCLYKVADFNSDDFADIAIRCRETGEITRKIKDELVLYTIQKGKATRIQVEDKSQFDRISSVLCDGQSSPICETK
jgi:hypothetical protein